MDKLIAGELEALRQSGLLRQLRVSETLDGMRIKLIDGSTETIAVNFCGNDYLGLAASKRLLENMGAAPSGAGASRLISGTHQAHLRFENEIAAFLGQEAALLFPSGFQANLGIITSVAGICGEIISDSDNHASLIDACRLARAKVSIIPHRDLHGLEKALQASSGLPLVVLESLYSMNGDAWDLGALAELKKRRPFILMLDEAHGFGAYGPQGRGVAARAGALAEVDIYMSGMGKAMGLSGAFVASSSRLIELLINKARSFIFTTASSPLLAELASEALKIIRDAESLRRKLQDNVKTFKELLGYHNVHCPGESFSAIIPIIIGDPKKALDAGALLLRQGFFVQAIRPPTVPEGSSRLRVSLSALHSTQDIQGLAEAIAKIHERFPIG